MQIIIKQHTYFQTFVQSLRQMCKQSDVCAIDSLYSLYSLIIFCEGRKEKIILFELWVIFWLYLTYILVSLHHSETKNPKHGHSALVQPITSCHSLVSEEKLLDFILAWGKRGVIELNPYESPIFSSFEGKGSFITVVNWCANQSYKSNCSND